MPQQILGGIGFRALLWLVSFLPAIGSPALGLTKAELFKLIQEGVEESVIVLLVEKDCVEFEIDASTVLELVEIVPTSVIEAAIACRKDIDRPAVDSATPATSVPNSKIALADAPPLQLRDIRTVVVIPLMLDNVPDEALTAAMVEQLRKSKGKYEVVDAVQLQICFEESGAFHSAAPVKSLLAAARSEGVDGIIIGTANKYMAFDDYAIRLDVKLLEVNRGKVLWSDGARGKSGLYSWQSCKKHTARNVVRKMP